MDQASIAFWLSIIGITAAVVLAIVCVCRQALQKQEHHDSMTDLKIVSGQVLRNKPEISALIGQISAEWSILEMMFEMYMAPLLGGNTRITAALCNRIRNTETKRQMLVGLIDVTAPDSPQKTTAKQLLAQVPKLAKARNELIHGIILHDEDQSNIRLVQFTTTDPRLRGSHEKQRTIEGALG